MQKNKNSMEDSGYLQNAENGKRLQKVQWMVRLLLAIIVAVIIILAVIIYIK
jgi:hypothetical protein